MRIFELPSRGKHLFNEQHCCTARIAIYMYAFRRIEMIFTFRPFWNEWHVTRAHAIRPGVGSVERTDGREEKNNVRPETWTRRTYRPARSNFIPEQTREVERRAKWKWPTDTCPLLSKEVPRILSAPFTVSLRSPPRRNDAGHPCRGFPLRYRLLSTARNQASINASIIEFAYRRPFTRRNHDKTVSRY